jgi:hypothetical protein
MKYAARAAGAFLIVGISFLSAQANDTDAVHKFLRSYFLKSYPGADRETRIAIAFSDLNGDGKQEAVVYVMGPDWCGTGGCHALVLSPDGSTFKVVMDAWVSQLPIKVLPTKSHGWHDLGVAIAGGGGQSGVAEMKFNGTTYPDNPTVPPAKLLKGASAGKILIGETDGEPL